MSTGIQKYIKDLHKKKEYRPVAVAILYIKREDDHNLFLITKTPIENAKTPWSFPQGGIDPEENIDKAIVRELYEEIGVSSDKLKFVQLGFLREHVAAESSRIDKRGFTKGKAYIFSIVEYLGKPNILTLNPTEVDEAKWVSHDEASLYLTLARPEKAVLLKKALDEAVKLIHETGS